MKFSAFCWFLLLAQGAQAWQGTLLPSLDVSRATAPIVVDGRLDDAGWLTAARAGGFTEHSPGDQVQPPVDTEVLVTHDDIHLYVAFLCRDDPALIRASFCERDQIWSDDYVVLQLDTFADQAWAYELAVNPLGIQGDAIWSATAGEDDHFDVVYRSAARITDDGWEAELAIPFRSLRFPDRAQQAWRVEFTRYHPRAVAGEYSWAAYDRDQPCWPCQWGTLRGMSGVRPGSGLSLLPAFVAHVAGERAADGRWDQGPVVGEPSLGAGYAVSSSVTAEATLNPDFSQVEADAAQVDVNSTFALFYPERRPFFQEGSDLFETWFSVVYTRTINDPFWAAKVTGRPGRSNVAVLCARDEHSPYILPFAESSAAIAAGRSLVNVVRFQQTLGEQSHVGVVATDRRLDEGGAGTAVSADGRLRLGQNHALEMQAVVTRTEEPDDPSLTPQLAGQTFDEGRHTSSFDGEDFWGEALHASVERSARHWNWDLDYWQRSPTFRVDNGFEPRNDQRLGIAATHYTVYRDAGLLESLEPSLQVARMWDYADRRQDEWVMGRLDARLRWAQAQLSAGRLLSDELYHDIRFAGIEQWDAEVSAVASAALRGGASYSDGHRIARRELEMGHERQLELWCTLQPSDRLVLETSYAGVRSDALDDGARLFDADVVRARLGLQITREFSLRLIAQYSGNWTDDDGQREGWDLDPLLAYRLDPFSIFYLGSTHDLREVEPGPDDDGGWHQTARQYFLKLQYLLRI